MDPKRRFSFFFFGGGGGGLKDSKESLYGKNFPYPDAWFENVR